MKRSTSQEQRTRGADYEAPTPVPKTQRTRGRPSDFEPELIGQACDLIRQGATDREVCTELGIGVTTFWRWREEYPEFRKAVALAKDAQDDRVEASLMRVANEGNTTAQIFWLKNRRPERWRDRHETEIVVPNNSDAPALDNRDMALAALALFSSAVYDPSQPAGPVIEGHAREEIGHGENNSPGSSGSAESARETPDPDFDGHPFDLDPGEV